MSHTPPVICWGPLLEAGGDAQSTSACAGSVAQHLAQLGRPVALASCIPSEAPAPKRVRALARAGVDTRLVQFGPGDRIDYRPELQAVVRRAGAFVFGTRSGHSPTALRVLSAALGETHVDCPRLCRINLRLPDATTASIDTALRHATLVQLDERAAADIAIEFGCRDIWRWLLYDRQIEVVAVLHSDGDSSLIDRSGRVRSAPLGKAVGASLGRGWDAFSAMLLHQWLDRAPLDQANEHANQLRAEAANEALAPAAG